MTAPKTYRCLSYPSLQLGELKFENGTFTTAEPREQRFVERHPEFIRGAIKVADGFQVAGAAFSTEMRLDPAVRNNEFPNFVPEPIPPPDPRLLKMHGLLPPEPIPEPVPELPPEPTLTSEEKVALDKIINGELPPVIQPEDIPPDIEPDKTDATPAVAVVEVDIPPDTAPLEKLPYPSIARRWGRLRLVKLATDRGIVGAEGATKDALLDLLYPDAE
jgi:hypothetical protein